MKLYQFELSPFSDKVRRILNAKSLTYEPIEILVSKAGKYRHISPTGKFPVLDDGGRLIVDSTDIVRYLDATYPAVRLAPDHPADAALATILEDWADESLYFYDLTMRAWPQNREWFLADLLHHEPPGLVRNLLARFIPGALLKGTKAQGLGRKSEATVVADLTALFDALDARLADKDWLAGPRLSTADIAVRVMVNLLERTVEAKALVGKRPLLAAWAARVDAAAPPSGLSVTRR